MMKRDDCFEALKRHITNEIVVATYTSAHDWVAIAPRELNYFSTGAMGLASSHALGIALGAPHELKQHSAGGTLLELACGDTARALAIAAAVAGVHDAAVFGNTVHVTATSIDAADAVRAALRAGGLADARVRAIAPSMEDMFVHLVQAARAPAVAGSAA